MDCESGPEETEDDKLRAVRLELDMTSNVLHSLVCSDLTSPCRKKSRTPVSPVGLTHSAGCRILREIPCADRLLNTT